MFALYCKLPIQQILRASQQARKGLDAAVLRSLAESIRQEGLQNPVTVRLMACAEEGCQAPVLDAKEGFPPCPAGTHWHGRLVAGERRLLATRLLKEDEIDVKLIQTVSEAEAAVKGLIENLQRVNLNPIEEAEGFQALLDMKDEHWTQERIGAVSGKPQSRISESVRLLSLPTDIVASIRQRIMTREHGIELMRINNTKEQKRLALKVGKNGLSVKQLRQLIDRKLDKPAPAKSAGQAAKSTAEPIAEPIAERPDLLAETWTMLRADPTLSQTVLWESSYSPQAFANGPTLDAWHFTVAPSPDTDAGAALAHWFEKTASLLRSA